MRVWDVAAGYLNRGSLLGEHRELHGLHTILTEGKRGYSRHPETLRWIDALSGLRQRHGLLAAEMRLRGYTDRTPLRCSRRPAAWPRTFIDPPGAQFTLLRSKYVGRPPGRIALPRSAHELWAHHKYSTMARDPAAYRTFGRRIARAGSCDLDAFAAELVDVLRTAPEEGRLRNALEHMWGYVRQHAVDGERDAINSDSRTLLRTIQCLAVRHRQPYLLDSTALSELAIYV